MRIPLLLLWLLISTSNLVAQVLVTGQVTDDTGERLIGASILELGTTNGTITDVDGRFALSVPNTATRLRFSYVGTQEKTVTVRTGKVSAGGKEVTLQVRLSLISSQLAEVVVTGYSGTLERKDLVGSYDAVRAEDLELDRPVESIDKLLTGQIAGLNVVNTTGEPGLPVQVQLRGQSSLPQITGSNISASNQPLFVLDGVPLFDVTEQNTDGSVFSDLNSQRLNPLAFLNPEDIESITVLKDASATALYGADAANGVILITTKSGTQEARIQLNYNQGFANTINEVQFLNTEQYVELARETLFNSGRNPAEAGTTDVTTDWRELVQRTSTNRDLDLSFSGKTYRISAGYNQLESIHQGNGSEQFNWSAKINAPLGQRFEVSTRVTGSYQLRQGLSSFDVFSFPPNLPVRLPDGEFNNDGFFDRRANPAALLEQNDNETKSWNWNTNANIKYNPSEQLQFRFLVGLDQLSSRQFQYKSALNGSGRTQNGALRLGDRSNTQWVSNFQGNWTPRFTQSEHNLSFLLGGELTGQLLENLVVSGNNFPFDDLRQVRFLAREDIDASESEFERRKASAYGEMAYNYDYRYYVKLNGRRDATSIFGGDQQAELLWALGLGWTLSEEDWWQDVLGISFAKLRFSYGVTGNSRIGVYTARGLYRFSSNSLYGGQVPLFASAPINDLLSWERKRQLNLALNLDFGPSRAFSLNLEYYRNTTIDGITNFRVPLESGFNSLTANAASLRNQGVEATLNYRTPGTGRWQYSTNFNIAHNQNVLLDINTEGVPGSATDPRVFRIGEDVNTLYLVPWAGVDPATGEQQWLLANGEITTDDDTARELENFVPSGNSNPDVIGGWRHSLSYGPLTLNVLLNYRFGANIRVDPLTFTDGRQILFNNQSVNQLDRWRAPGDVTDVPRLDIDNPIVNASTRYLYELDFVQLASVALYYDLKTQSRLPLGLHKLRIYALANNLGYHYFGDDTPDNRNGVRQYRFTFPEQRAFVFGINMTW